MFTYGSLDFRKTEEAREGLRQRDSKTQRENLLLQVLDLVLRYAGKWDFHLLSSLYPNQVVQQFARYPVPLSRVPDGQVIVQESIMVIVCFTPLLDIPAKKKMR
ncbi:hypothetical protein K1719_008137 [Acacia pycnantha]|nr:hypothetical protein K1719_008137 [Acacia pycnantha]